MNDSPLIILTAAEASGDQHAAALARAIRQLCPRVRLAAFGGPKLQAAGVELLADLSARSAMLLGAVGRAPAMFAHLVRFDRYLARYRPALHITVDSPAANLPFAGRSKAHGVPVLGYVAPQLWAWGGWRMGRVRRRIDRLACILPFEPEFFRPHGIAAEFVGHPIFEPLAQFSPDAGFIAALPASRPRVALLPGSRSHEIAAHLPAQLRIAAAVRRTHPQASFVLAAPPAGHGHSLDVRRLMKDAGDIRLVEGRLHEVLAWSDVVLAVSGSVTLEVAWFARPMVIMYHVPRWQWQTIGRRLLKTRFMSLPNVVAGRQVVPELMPWFGRDEPVVAAINELLADPARRQAISVELAELVRPLAATAASRRVAQIALEMVESQASRQPRTADK